jgi:subtilisin family serine protease
MSRRAFGRFLAAGIAAGAGLLSVPVGAQGPLELRVSARKTARIPVLVELTAEPAARIYGRSLEQAAAGRGAALAEARGAVQAHLRAIERAQDGLATALQARFDARVSYRVGRALNAIAVQVEPTRLDEIRQMPGVKAVHVLEIEYPTSSTSVPFLGVPQLWDNALGLGRNLTGAGIRIGIIDTGVDYQHSNLGGTGLLGGYQANDRTTIADGFFPTAKVVGGTDFVGDS